VDRSGVEVALRLKLTSAIAPCHDSAGQ